MLPTCLLSECLILQLMFCIVRGALKRYIIHLRLPNPGLACGIITWLEMGHYWQVMIDKAQMDLKQCLTYLYCTQVTYILVCKRLAHYCTLQQLSYYLKPLTPSVFILLWAINMFFLIILHLHYLVYYLPGYSQITNLLKHFTYPDNAHQKVVFNSFVMVPVSSQQSHYWLRYKLFVLFVRLITQSIIGLQSQNQYHWKAFLKGFQMIYMLPKLSNKCL